MRINSRESSRLDPESIRLPLIALIDVVLFLLFYFVISFSLSVEEKELQAGVAMPGPATSELAPQILEVWWPDGRAEFRLGEQAMRDRAQLAALLRSLPKEPGLIVRSSPEAPVEALAAAVQAARDAGFLRVSYAPWTR